jgi:tRNA modification GTPase
LPVDTIVAAATAPGRAGIGIVRLSGPAVKYIAQKFLDKLPAARYAHYVSFKQAQGEVIDRGLLLFFPAPHSFTGEDVLELQVHGSPVVIDRLIHYLLDVGARLARPGEFSERAFLNGKMDLAQAEAVADLINANSVQAARAAICSLEGVFSQKIHSLTEKLIHLRMYIEAALDFAEEEIDFLSEGKVARQLEEIKDDLNNIQYQANQGVLLQEGMTVVIAGKPNAGKSSLLNLLSGRDSAIVTPIPGTTRDVLREFIHIDGLPLEIIDTAGLRESSDLVEQEGVKRAREHIGKADRVLYLRDITEEEIDNDVLLRHPRVTLVYNKVDLAPLIISRKEKEKNIFLDIPVIKISAKTGEGLDVLKKHLKNCMGFEENKETNFSARRRHLDALKRAKICLEQAINQLREHHAGECVAEDLRLTQQALGEITGEFSNEDLLSRIFSRFCIGK